MEAGSQAAVAADGVAFGVEALARAFLPGGGPADAASIPPASQEPSAAAPGHEVGTGPRRQLPPVDLDGPPQDVVGAGAAIREGAGAERVGATKQRELPLPPWRRIQGAADPSVGMAPSDWLAGAGRWSRRPDQVRYLIVEAFAGCSPMAVVLRRAEAAAGRPLLGREVLIVTFETGRYARRLLASRGIGVIRVDAQDADGTVGSAALLAKGDFFGRLLQQFPRLKLTFITGGPPCLDISPGKIGAAGPAGPESGKMVYIAVAVSKARAEAKDRPEPFQVAFAMENVDPKQVWVQDIDRLLAVESQLHDAASASPVARKRRTWANFQLGPLLEPGGVPLQVEDILDEGWRPAWELLPDYKGVHTFCTFTKMWEPGGLPEFPDSEAWTFTLPTYAARGLVYKVGASAQARRQAAEALATSAAKGDVRQLGSPANVKRRELAKLIHTSGLGQVLRPLNALEREKGLGMPAGYSAPPEGASQDDLQDRFAVLANAWSLHAFEPSMKPIVSAILSGGTVDLGPEAEMPSTIQEAFQSLRGSGGQRRRVKLSRAAAL